MCAHGFFIYNIMKPDPLFGVNVGTLRSHGMTDELLQIARNWKEVNRLIAPEQRERIRRTLYFADDPCRQAGSHEKSAVVHVLSKESDRWAIHPTRVLARKGDADAVWHDGQEHGAISPRQFLKPGEVLRLVNPYRPQRPKIILGCLWALNYDGATSKAPGGRGADAEIGRAHV